MILMGSLRVNIDCRTLKYKNKKGLMVLAKESINLIFTQMLITSERKEISIKYLTTIWSPKWTPLRPHIQG